MVRAEVPLLISTAEYGEYHPVLGSYGFDFTAADRYRITAPGIDYYFYYGPTPKEIFEEHNAVRPAAEAWPVTSERFGSWSTLRASLLRMVHAAMSAVLAPEFDLAPYANAPPELVERARQLGSLVPKVTPGAVGLSDFRKQLASFFDVYALEIRDHGHPTWHPLPFEFPDDAEGARHADEFMLGDEMLVAPIYEPGGKRSVYLPRGVWTNLETNEVFQGKRTIAVETKSLPVFARNGEIVPLNSAVGIDLHYFPKLGAEFFLLESDVGDYSQVHAAPAGDIMRLEIESKKDRGYQWVVHHVEKPTSVGFQNVKYREVPSPSAMPDRSWFYDTARKDLHVRARVTADEDSIVNVAPAVFAAGGVTPP
jgi:alpha-glucosidase (family GH31 glycosyl hydrolase)